MILVTGAGGKTGKAVIKALTARGEAVRAFVHRAGYVSPLQALGAESVIVGDMRDEAALSGAMEGARAVYHICPNVNAEEQRIGELVISAARAVGVERFVFHSVLHPQAEAMPHHWNKLRVEEALFEAGVPCTILQPTAYMQNLLAGWKSMVDEGVLRNPYPVETRISLVDLEDVAAAAAKVLTEQGHAGATYELVGTPPMSQVEVAEVLSKALGRQVRAEAESVEVWEERAKASGMGDYQRETLVKMFRYYEQYGLAGNSNGLRWLAGRKPRGLEEWARRQSWSSPSPSTPLPLGEGGG